MKINFLDFSQIKTWLKATLISSLLATSCTVDNQEISLESNSTNSQSTGTFELPVVGIVSDTGSQTPERTPAEAIDEDAFSRWAASGEGVNLDLDLGELYNVEYINISWYKGDKYTYDFNVYSSTDGETFTLLDSKTSTGTTIDLESYDITDGEYQYLRLELFGPVNTGKGNNMNSIYDIEVYGSIIEPEVVNTQNAFITDTSDADTGELRLDLSDRIAIGKMSVTISKEATQDGFINLSGSSTTRKYALIDMRIDDSNGYEFTESGDTVNAIANFPTFNNNELVEVVMTWDVTNAAGPLVFVTIDGQAVTDEAFVSESQDLALIQDGVKTVQFRLGGKSSLDASGAGMAVDNLKVYDTSSGTDVVVFEDDFESYEVGYSLDPNEDSVITVANSPYRDNSFQVTVQPIGSIVDPETPKPATDGFGPSTAATGEITWKNWYLSVPIDRADGSGKATSIYYNDILANDLTTEERTYFDFNADGSFKMDAKFTGYTTSGYKELFGSGYCRTELREYWQGNQTASDNWYMDGGTHILESTLSVQKAEGEGKVYVAQIHGKSGISSEGVDLTKSPATVKVQWYDNNIILEYYTIDGVVDGEWTSASGTVAKATIGEVGNNKFTVRLKSEEGKFYMALYCEATGVDTGYLEYYDYGALGYTYQNYFKTGNYFRHDEDYTSVSEVTLYSAITSHE